MLTITEENIEILVDLIDRIAEGEILRIFVERAEDGEV